MTARPLSAALKRQLLTPHRDEDIRVLITAEHADFAEPFRFVDGDPIELPFLVSNGLVFTTFPFELTLVNDDDQEPSAMLRIMNVDDRIGSTFLGLSSEAVRVTIQAVLRTSPDTIEYEAARFELVDVVIDAMAVSGRLTRRGLSSELCPGRVMTARISPVISW